MNTEMKIIQGVVYRPIINYRYMYDKTKFSTVRHYLNEAIKIKGEDVMLNVEYYVQEIEVYVSPSLADPEVKKALSVIPKAAIHFGQKFCDKVNAELPMVPAIDHFA